MAQSCTARSSGSMTIPRHCSWVRPPERARVAAATSDGRVLVRVSDIATHTVRPAEPSWARTISNRRPLVCKAAAKRPHGLVGLPRCRYVQVMSPRCVAASTASRLVVARLGTLWAHRGWPLRELQRSTCRVEALARLHASVAIPATASRVSDTELRLHDSCYTLCVTEIPVTRIV
jgi:hypothetical protein